MLERQTRHAEQEIRKRGKRLNEDLALRIVANGLNRPGAAHEIRHIQIIIDSKAGNFRRVLPQRTANAPTLEIILRRALAGRC